MIAGNEDDDREEDEAWAREMVRELPPMGHDAVEALECIGEWLTEFRRLRSA